MSKDVSVAEGARLLQATHISVRQRSCMHMPAAWRSALMQEHGVQPGGCWENAYCHMPLHKSMVCRCAGTYRDDNVGIHRCDPVHIFEILGAGQAPAF